MRQEKIRYFSGKYIALHYTSFRKQKSKFRCIINPNKCQTWKFCPERKFFISIYCILPYFGPFRFFPDRFQNSFQRKPKIKMVAKPCVFYFIFWKYQESRVRGVFFEPKSRTSPLSKIPKTRKNFQPAAMAGKWWNCFTIAAKSLSPLMLCWCFLK